MNGQCGPSYGDNANFDSAGSSVGISFTTDSSCSGMLTSITIDSGFAIQPTSPDDTEGFATIRLYEGNGLSGTVLATLTNVNIGITDTFDFSALMIPMNTASQYTVIFSEFTLPTLTGRGFNTPWVPPYTGGSLYMNDVERPGEHLAFSVNINNATLSIDDIVRADKHIQIYPNPTANTIQLTALKEIENYIIFDVHGKKVLEGNVQEHQKITVEHLQKGIYFIQLYEETLQFIKN